MTLGGVALGPARRKPRRPPDQDRRQSRSSREPGRDGPVRAGLGAHAVRSGSLAVDPAARRNSPVERGHRRDSRRRCRRSQRRRAPAFASSPKRWPRRRSPRRFSRCSRLHPGAKWIQWEPVNRDNARAGARAAFGQYRRAALRPDEGRRHPLARRRLPRVGRRAQPLLLRQFASRRRVEDSADNLNRLYVVEPTHTVTGGRADNRVPIKASQIEAFARAVAARDRRRAASAAPAPGGLGGVCRRGREGSGGAPRPRAS